MATPEGKVKNAHKAYFKAQGWYYFFPVQMGLGASTLDCLLCIKGRFIAIEFKREDRMAYPTPRQAQVIKAINKAGGIAFTTNSLERTKQYLQDHVLGVYNPEVG